MSVQAIGQTSIDSFVERVNRLYNRSQKLHERMASFSQRWGLDEGLVTSPKMTTVSEESVVKTHVEPEVPYVEPVQPIVQEPVETNTNQMDINLDDIDLDGLLDGIKLDDDELSL